MTTATPDTNAQLRWPAERFYWAVLEAPGWSRSGPLPEGLRAEFDDEAPIPAEELHAVCTPVAGGRVLVCAARRGELAVLPPGTLSLTPDGLPECIGSSEGMDDAAARRACDALNLLVGPFEPRPLRRARLMRHALAATCVGLCSLLAATGLSRRAAHWNAVADAAAAARAELLQRTVPATADAPEALAVELARLRQGQTGAARIKPAPDAAAALASVLRGWPADVPARPQSLNATGAEATLSVNLEGDPAAFLKAISAPAGWSAGEPRLNTSGGTTRVVLQMRAGAPAEEPHP